MCPQTPRLSPEYSHKAGLQTVITGMPLQIRPVMRSGHAGPVTMGRITRGPPCWTRSQDETTSSQVFVRWRMGRRVSLPVVLSPLVQRGRRRHRAKGGVFAFAPTLLKSRWHVLRGLPFYERSMQVKIIIACFTLHNYLLDWGHIGGSGSSSHGHADYDVSDWLNVNASLEMTLLRDWIAAGISLM
jgi:hypothetical protein